MSPGDVWLGRFPMAGSGGVKLRPVLVLTGPLGTVPEFLTAYISSVIPDPLLPSDIMLDPALPDHAATNLKAKSVLRLHKLSTVQQRGPVRRLGICGPVTFQLVQANLRAVLNL